jgi:predicted small secreted protein
MIRRLMAMTLAVAAFVSLCGCMNTMGGIGRDMEHNSKTAVKAVTR